VKGFFGNIKRIFLLLVGLACIVSCAKKSPEGIMSRPEMVQVMEDIYIAEEKINQLALSRDSAKIVFEVMQGKVFENAATSDSAFRKSFDYYMERPKEMELIYTALVDTLQLREQRSPFRPEQP
jgi:hypothetical protein